MGEDHDHDHHEDTAGLAYKLPTAAGLFLFSCFCTYAPFWIKKLQANMMWQSIANSLAGGVFLAAAFIHIMPHALEQWKDEPKVANLEFPWIFFIATCSFAILLLVDRVILGGHNHHHHHVLGESVLPSSETSPNHIKPCCDSPVSDGPILSSPNRAPIECQLAVCAVDHEVEGKKDHQEIGSQPAKPKQQAGLVSEAQHLKQVERPLDQQPTTASKAETSSPRQVAVQQPKPNLLGTASVIFSMGFHAIFEGLALGLLANFSGFLGFLAAILFHKWAESMAVGFNIMRNNLTFCQRIVAIALFALLDPIGIIIGILVSTSDKVTLGVLLAITGGTFLYIGIADIISHEFEGKQHKWIKFLCFVIGNCIMILAWYFESLTHDHHH